jgi:AAA family ATP:ADP antiporter
MKGSLLRRLLSPIAQLRDEEALTALMMFAYSFLAMTAYNIVKPITRSKFIEGLGADNLPWVQLGAGLLIGVIMAGYSRAVGLLPRRWVIPITQAGMTVIMLGFWVIFQTEAAWAPVAFYLLGLILGLLLISQFWTLANDIYDPRQAKRIFGFIGGGASLGGILGSAILTFAVDNVGTVNLLLISAFGLSLAAALVSAIVMREKAAGATTATVEEKGVGFAVAIRLLKESRHLQTIALVIAFAAIGAAIIEQQLNLAAEASKGQKSTDAITAFLGTIQLYTSIIGFVIQVWLTSRIHKYLGIGFALMVLPVSLGATGVLILATRAFWAPGVARVLDTSLRYTVDKTTREVLFLPLPTDLKYQAKPFVDVTVDRFAKAMGALLCLVLIKDWGLGLTWPALSYASLIMTGLWILMAIRARRGYLKAFRTSIERRDVVPTDVRLNVADLSTVETLVEELSNQDPRRVVYAIEMLESLDKRNLITPLLLHHESEQVRIRALAAIEGGRPEVAQRWLPAIERMLKDPSGDVRAGAVRALSAVRAEDVAHLMRKYLDDRDPRVKMTAAVALADSPDPNDVAASEAALKAVTADTRQASAASRREVASAISRIKNPALQHLLIPLLYDADLSVAQEAIRSARQMAGEHHLLVPPLITLLRNRRLKAQAREVLVSYGEEVIDVLGYFLQDPEEDIWVRRHIPGTLALFPTQKSMDLLVAALDDPDGFLRYKVVAAMEKLRREHADLTIAREPIEALAVKEANRYFSYLTLRHNLFQDKPHDSLLCRALEEKLLRTVDRIYRLIGLVYPWKDIAAARWAIDHGDARASASASEYLDNLLTGTLRKRVLPVLEETPIDEKVRKGNVFLRSRRRDAEETLAQLIADEDQVVAAAAIHYVEKEKIWNLADDLEHALAHRDVKDWYVFEAASWALAAHRLPVEKRRELWMEPLPAVVLANRLRRIPLFDFVSVDELFRIAGMGRQVRHESGRVLYQQGAPADDIQFLLDGKVSVTQKDARPVELQAPAALNFEEALEGSPSASTIRAVDVAICLALNVEEFMTLLSDNTLLAQGLFRMLMAKPSVTGWRTVVRGPAAAATEPQTTAALSAIDEVVVLHAVPLFARATPEQLLALGRISDAVELKEGAQLFSESDRAAIYTIMAGEVTLEGDGLATTQAGPGDTVGVFETLGFDRAGWRARVTAPGQALRIDREELFDLLGEHMELLQGLFSALLRFDAEKPSVAA